MQIKDRDLEFSRRAEISLDCLSELDKTKVFKNIEKVLSLELQPPYAARLKGMKDTFLVRASRNLRVIFSVGPKSIRILDIMPHDKLKHLSMIGRGSGVKS